jgi:hypothetical protein
MLANCDCAHSLWPTFSSLFATAFDQFMLPEGSEFSQMLAILPESERSLCFTPEKYGEFFQRYDMMLIPDNVL